MKLIVLIAHFNNLSGLEKSILSIDESFEVDLLIVDDGSDIKPDQNKLESLYKNGKLFVEYLPKNKGLGYALNHGLKTIQNLDYDWIGRLDCGDLNKKDKYKKQFEYVAMHPNVKLLGTAANIIDTKGNLIHTLQHPNSHQEIKKKMYLNSCFVHPSVIFKKEVIEKVGHYPDKYAKAAQDYAYFFNIMKKFEVGNIPEPLLDYIMDENSISIKNRNTQVKNRIKIICDNFYWGYYPLLGLIRNYLLLILPHNITFFFKRKFKYSPSTKL